MRKPTRIALLIGASGGLTTTFLPGVSSDLENVKLFLLSSRGGAWFDHEIIVLDDPDKAEIYIALHEIYADYVIVYYSGHGFQTHRTRNYFALTNGEEVEDVLFLNDSPRQLILADCCSDLLPPRISGLPPHLGEDFRYGDPEELLIARKFYDFWIASCAPGKVILHSTGPGTSSYDTPTGGVFTKALLGVGKSFGSKQTAPELDILSSAKFVLPELKNRRSEQVPTKTYLEGNGNLPFAVAPELLPRYKKVKQVVHKNSNTGTLFALGLVGLGFYLASED